MVQLLREGGLIQSGFGPNMNHRMLTPKQRQIFDSALNEGYWDTPRRITLSDLAGFMGLSKSTLSVHLHKIEGIVLNVFAEEVRRNSP